MKFAAIALAGCLVLFQPATSSGADVISPQVRSELYAETKHLVEIMRQDVEETNVDVQNVILVPLTSTTPDNTVYPATGVIVPFSSQVRGGGNAFQQFLALYRVMVVDEQRLRDFGHGNNPHKDVALLGFAQIDNRHSIHVDWSRASVDTNIVSLPTDVETKSDQQHWLMIVHVNDNGFGPKVEITFEKGQLSVRPPACNHD